MRRIRLFSAFGPDLKVERALLTEVARRLNANVGNAAGIRIEVCRELDMLGLGASDVVVVALHNEIWDGADALGRSMEPVGMRDASGPTILLYRCDRPSALNTIEALQSRMAVLQTFDRLAAFGAPKGFIEPAAFADVLTSDLQIAASARPRVAPPGTSEVHRPSVTPVRTQPSVPCTVEEQPADPAIPSFVSTYRPFVESLPDWRELLTATNRLLTTRTWEELRTATADIFCSVLGFDDDRVSLTTRVGRRSAIADFEQIGSFGDFRICVVRLTRSLSDTKWSNTVEHYRPCFRLAPRALIVSYEPGAGAIRLVYRQRHGRRDTRLRYRCIVGPAFLRDSQENLLTICRRLHLCRPEFGEDTESLTQRVQSILECEAGALARAWSSLPLAGEDLPGLRPSKATVALMRAFVETEGWCWGLAAHLHNVFPAPLEFDEAWLDCIGFTPLGHPGSAEVCWRTGRSLEQRLTVTLAVRSWDSLRVRETFEITASLLVPDLHGRFWIEGRPYRYLPEVTSDGRLLSRTSMPQWVDALNEDEDEDEDDEELDEPDTSTPSDTARWPLTDAEGAVVDAVIGRAIERRLYRRVRTLRRRRALELAAGPIRARLLNAIPPGGALPLLTPVVARRLLTPVDLARPFADPSEAATASSNFVETPPAWACPDLSAQLPPGRWAIVAGARVHPTGVLAVPVEANGQLRLTATDASAFAVNPRLGATGGGDRRWWINERLSDYAHLDAGVLEAAEQVVGAGVRIAATIVVSPEVEHAQLNPTFRPRGAPLRISVDVPRLAKGQLSMSRPTVLVEPGQRIDAGTAWVQVPTAHLAHHADDAESTLVILDPGLRAIHRYLALVERTPWADPVRVRRAGVEPVERFGHTLAWRAWLEVLPVVGAYRVVGDDGRLQHIDEGWRPGDMPYPCSGAVFDGAIGGEPGETVCFSAVDGDAIDVAIATSVTVVPTPPRPRPAAVRGALDRLPRPGVRSIGESWCVSRLRWLAEGLPDGAIECLSAGDAHRALLLWCAGVGPAPSDVPVETVDGIPLSTRPHKATEVLSDLRWIARCPCGNLAAPALLGARCMECGGQVTGTEHLERLRQVSLPIAVVHPWAKETAAALLGLVPTELDTLLTRHGPEPALAACRSALQDPSRAARQRCNLEERHPRALTGQARRRLGQVAEALDRVDVGEQLALDRVGVPSLGLVAVGHILNESAIRGSPLMAAFGRLNAACLAVRDAHRTTISALRSTAEAHLQACVDRVFGMRDDANPASIAGLLRTVNPWTRGPWPAVIMGPPISASWPRDEVWWACRAARANLIENYAIALIALVDDLPTLPAHTRQAAVKAVAADLLDPERDPRGLLALVHAEHDRPTQLPSDWATARRTLEDRLGSSLGPVALPAVVDLLGGWWLGEPSPERPSGAVWVAPAGAGPPTYRRRIPPLSHVLWRAWPDGRGARPACTWFPLSRADGFNPTTIARDVPDDPASEADREQAFEYTAADAAPNVGIEPSHPDRPPTPAPETPRAAVVATPRPARMEDIRVVDMTLKAWLETR